MFGMSFGASDTVTTTMALMGVNEYTSGLDRVTRAWEQTERAQGRAAMAPELKPPTWVRGGQMAGMAMTAGVSAPMLALLGRAGKLGMAAVESENLVHVTFGNMTKDVERWSNTNARNLGLNAFEIRRQAGVVQNLFTGAGFNPGKATQMSKTLIDAKNDMVSFFNTADSETQQNLLSGLAGEIEPLRKYGIFMTENTVKAYAYKNGIAALGSTLTEQQKVEARYGFIMSSLRSRNVTGDLERTKDSPANQMRRMRAELDMEVTKLGMSLMPLAQQGMELGRMIIPPIRAAVDWFGKLSPAAQKAGIAFGVLAGPTLLVTGRIAEVVFAAKAAKSAKDALTLATERDIVAERVKSGVAGAEARAIGGAGLAAKQAAGYTSELKNVNGQMIEVFTKAEAAAPAASLGMRARAAAMWARPVSVFGRASTVGRVATVSGKALGSAAIGYGVGKAVNDEYKVPGLGLGVGVGAAALAYSNPYSAAALTAGLAIRHVGDRYYNDPMDRAAQGQFYTRSGRRTQEGNQRGGNNLTSPGHREAAAQDLERRADEIEKRNVRGATFYATRAKYFIQTGNGSLADKYAEEDVRALWGWQQEADELRRAAKRQMEYARRENSQRAQTAMLAKSVSTARELAEPLQKKLDEEQRKAYAARGLDYDEIKRNAGIVTTDPKVLARMSGKSSRTFGESQVLDTYGLEDGSSIKAQKSALQPVVAGGERRNPSNTTIKAQRLRDGRQRLTLELDAGPGDDAMREALHQRMVPTNWRQ